MLLFIDPQTSVASSTGYSFFIGLVTLFFWFRSRPAPAIFTFGMSSFITALAGLLYIFPLGMNANTTSLLSNSTLLLSSVVILLGIELMGTQYNGNYVIAALLCVLISILIFNHSDYFPKFISQDKAWILGLTGIWCILFIRIMMLARKEPHYGKSLSAALALVVVMLCIIRLLTKHYLPAQHIHRIQISSSLILMTFWIGFGVIICHIYVIYDHNIKKLHLYARYDGLTQLLNRRSFMESGHLTFKQAIFQQQPLSLLVLDIDHFKQINDQYGHLAGDHTLLAFSNCLRAHARKTDLITRYGGEEFCILLPGTPYHEARLIAERLRNAIERIVVPLPLSTSNTEIRFTSSIGIATLNYNYHKALEQLIKDADDMLYRAKIQGRNRVC